MRLTVLAFLGGVSLSACGADAARGTVGSCGSSLACGGNVVASWRVKSMCVDVEPDVLRTQNPLPAVCQPAFDEGARAATADANVTLLFVDGGTYQETGQINLSITYDYDSDCLQASGYPPASDATCTSVAAGLSATNNSPTPPTCVYVSNVCRCSVNLYSYVNHSGTFRTQFGRLFLDESSSSISASGPYCVNDRTLTTTLSGPQGTIAFEMTR